MEVELETESEVELEQQLAQPSGLEWVAGMEGLLDVCFLGHSPMVLDQRSERLWLVGSLVFFVRARIPRVWVQR